MHVKLPADASGAVLKSLQKAADGQQAERAYPCISLAAVQSRENTERSPARWARSKEDSWNHMHRGSGVVIIVTSALRGKDRNTLHMRMPSSAFTITPYLNFHLAASRFHHCR